MKRFLAFTIIIFIIAGVIPAVTGCVATATCGGGKLENIAWTLKSYGTPGRTQPVLENTEITIQFISSGSNIGGTAGCNAYFADYQIDKTTCALTIGPNISTTKKGCEQPVMQQEQDYLALLKAVTGFSVTGGELQLTSGNEVLLFSRRKE